MARAWAVERKLAAKRYNERVKLFAAFFNALGIGAIGAGVIVPAARTPIGISPASSAWLVMGFGLHLVGQAAYRALRSED